MGIFSKKKEPEVKKELPPLKFPELPQEFEEQKQEISASDKQMIREAVAPQPLWQAMPERAPAPETEGPEEKPLFVKIEKYRDVMATLNELKNKLKDATDILVELNEVKQKEEQELTTWHADLEAVKEKLASIDKTLFEV